MKKANLFALIALLTLALFTAACGSKASVADGVRTMKQTLGELQKNVDAGDAAKVKQNADALEEEWEKFEDSVKDKSKDVYEKVEDPLGKIKSGAKASTLDKNVLTQEAKKLADALADAEKLK
jgi:iron uptake system EfeUOB component EfeO/EfeM